jgi:hypothetical protein
MSQTDSIVARIMSIRNGMILDADAEALIRDALDARQTSPVTETARRKERISMAKEICSHRGENSNAVDRRGNEGWEKYEPLAGACIREAERLFALRDHAQDQKLSVLIKQYAIDLRRNASGGDDYPYEYAKATADYLEELIKRAKGNCTCAQAGFPDSCDNCDAFDHAQTSQVPDGYVLMPREATRAMTMAACDSLPSCEHVFGHAGEMLRNCYRKMVAVVDSSPDRRGEP